MARQISPIKLTGTLGGITLYEDRRYGALAKEKSSLTGKRFKKDPAFERSRESSREFGEVAHYVKYFRKATNQLFPGASDNTFTSRLTSVFCKIKALDPVSVRGQRNLTNAFTLASARSLFTGFSFNQKAPLDQVLKCEWQVNAGNGQVILNNFIPSLHLKYPEAATHVEICSAFSSIDFLNKNVETRISNKLVLPINDVASTQTLSPASIAISGINFCFLRIIFYQEINGVLYPLKDKTSNNLTVIS